VGQATKLGTNVTKTSTGRVQVGQYARKAAQIRTLRGGRELRNDREMHGKGLWEPDKHAHDVCQIKIDTFVCFFFFLYLVVMVCLHVVFFSVCLSVCFFVCLVNCLSVYSCLSGRQLLQHSVCDGHQADVE
jgi:hypothetical protein